MIPKDAAGSVPEYFVSCLDHIELLTGNNARHVWVSQRRVGDKVLYIPEVHIIMSNSVVPDGILKITEALAIALIGFDQAVYH